MGETGSSERRKPSSPLLDCRDEGKQDVAGFHRLFFHSFLLCFDKTSANAAIRNHAVCNLCGLCQLQCSAVHHRRHWQRHTRPAMGWECRWQRRGHLGSWLGRATWTHVSARRTCCVAQALSLDLSEAPPDLQMCSSWGCWGSFSFGPYPCDNQSLVCI